MIHPHKTTEINEKSRNLRYTFSARFGPLGQLRYEKLKDLQLEVVFGIVSGQGVFAIFPGALAVFDAFKTLDSSFHTEIILLRGSDGPRASPSRLLLSLIQEDKSLPHAQQYMITRICSTRARLIITFRQNGFSISVSPDPSSSKRKGGTARLSLFVATSLLARLTCKIINYDKHVRSSYIWVWFIITHR